MVRIKHRYLITEIIPEANKRLQVVNSSGHLYSVVRDLILETHGDFGLASVLKYLNVKYINPYTNIAIIRTRRGTQNMVSTALTFLRMLNGVKVTMRTLHVSGTLRSCQKFLARYHLQQLPHLLKDCQTVADQEAVHQALVSFDAVKTFSYKRKAEITEKCTEHMDIFNVG